MNKMKVLFSVVCAATLLLSARADKLKIEKDIAYYPEAVRATANGALDGCLLDLRYTDGVTGFLPLE